MKAQITPHQNEILYLEADVNYTIFHLRDGSKFVSAITLKKYESRFKEFDFLRINKSFLLNPTSINQVKHLGQYAKVILLNGREISVPRRKRMLVSEALMRVLK